MSPKSGLNENFFLPRSDHFKITMTFDKMGKSEENAGIMECLDVNGIHDFKGPRQFDLMEIRITVYSLSGIVCRTTRAKEGRSKPRRRLKLRKKPASDKNGSLGSIEVPTTAVVAFRRNICSSSSLMETFLPSEALCKPPLESLETCRQTAVWGSHNAHTSLDPESVAVNRPRTYTITRAMRRKSFSRGENLCHITNYIPETVDVRIGMSRGKEMQMCAMASLVVTGDEENESVSLIPLKPIPKKLKGKRAPSTTEWNPATKKSVVFPSEKEYLYNLEENAMLQVGVRASLASSTETSIPANTIAADQDIIPDGFDENMLFEFIDDSSLLDDIVVPAKVENQQSEIKNSTKIPLSFSNFVCGAFEMLRTCDDSTRVTVTWNDCIRDVSSKKINNPLPPLSLVSTVSESTFDRSSHALQSLANK